MHADEGLARTRRRGIAVALLIGCLVLLGTAAMGMVLERREGMPVVQVGQRAPSFSLTPSTGGGLQTLPGKPGQARLLAFVPSVQNGACQRQLKLLESELPRLSAGHVALDVVSTDEPAVQRTIARALHLTYPLLAENVIIDRHPAGAAYGVYHLAGVQQGPVDANALFLVDASGIIRGVDVRPAGQMPALDFERWLSAALGNAGGGS